MDSTEATISQQYHWTNLRYDIRTHIKVCSNFQKNKKQSLKYGFFTNKEAQSIPWGILLVDLIGSYEIRI